MLIKDKSINTSQHIASRRIRELGGRVSEVRFLICGEGAEAYAKQLARKSGGRVFVAKEMIGIVPFRIGNKSGNQKQDYQVINLEDGYGVAFGGSDVTCRFVAAGALAGKWGGWLSRDK